MLTVLETLQSLSLWNKKKEKPRKKNTPKFFLYFMRIVLYSTIIKTKFPFGSIKISNVAVIKVVFTS